MASRIEQFKIRLLDKVGQRMDLIIPKDLMEYRMHAMVDNGSKIGECHIVEHVFKRTDTMIGDVRIYRCENKVDGLERE